MTASRQVAVGAGAALVAVVLLALTAALAFDLPLGAWLGGFPDSAALAGAGLGGPGSRAALPPLGSSTLGGLGASGSDWGATSGFGTAEAGRHGSCAGYLCDATQIDSLPYSDTANTSSGSAQPVAATCAPSAAGTWFHYVPSGSGLVVAQASGYPLSVGAFEGTSPANLQQIACGRAATGVAQAGWFPVQAGRDYYIQVAGLAGGGRLSFELLGTGLTENVSAATGGGGADGKSTSGTVTADGRYVVFVSAASDLGPATSCPVPSTPSDPTSRHFDCWQVFMRDRLLGDVTAIGPAVTEAGTAFPDAPAIASASVSANGRYVAMSTDYPLDSANDSNGVYDVYLYDRVTGLLKLESTAYQSSTAGTPPATDFSCAANTNQPALSPLPYQCGTPGSFAPMLSADGRYLSFMSDDLDIVPGYGSDAVCDDSGGAVCLPGTTATGCDRTGGCVNQVYRRDLVTGQTEAVSMIGGAWSASAVNGFSMSADGRFLAFAFDSGSGVEQIYLRDFRTGVIRRVSSAPGGAGAPAISADGTHLGFSTGAGDYEWDARSGALTRIAANGAEDSISGDGRFVAFSTTASGITREPNPSGSIQIYLYDGATGRTVLLSASDTDQAGNGSSQTPFVSADGSLVVFQSFATNLVDGNTCNLAGCTDVLARPLR